MKINKIIKSVFAPIIGIIGLVTVAFTPRVKNPVPPKTSLYDIQINSIDNEPIDLSEFEGKKILIVNVASKCGFTPQYAELQKLHETYSDQLVIIGVPCNQFMNQEPGSAEEIANFCQKNYGVSFLITEKVDVKGKNMHPVYQWLTDKKFNGNVDSNVKWNFQKYLISASGELLEIFSSKTKPMAPEIIEAINS